MDAIFMNSGNSKASDSYTLLLNLAYKISLQISNKFVALSDLRICCTWKNISDKYICIRYLRSF